MGRGAVVETVVDETPVDGVVGDVQRLGVLVAPLVGRVLVPRHALVDIGDDHIVEAHSHQRLAVHRTPARDQQAIGSGGETVVDQRLQRVAVERHSCTSSMSVPKLPFGWTKATVVPLEPGRGAVSMAVPPAATTAASAAAQSSPR